MNKYIITNKVNVKLLKPEHVLMANPILAVVFPAVAVPVEPLLGVAQLAFLAKALTDRIHSSSQNKAFTC